MADLEHSLATSFVAAAPPKRGPELVEYAGGRRALVQSLTGMDHSPRKRDYPDEAAWKADYTKWRSAERRVQRWDPAGKEGKQVRGASRADLTSAQSRRVRQSATTRKVAGMRKRGFRARLKARVTVDTPNARGRKDTRMREIPAGGPGVFIPPDQAEAILEVLREGDRESAADWFTDALMEGYGMDPNVEVSDVQWLHVWPDGEPEPGLGTGGR